jgi:hypothetical protein
MSLFSELEDLKAAANVMPPENKALEALSMVDRGSPYQELFFSEICDARWLPLLESKGYFMNFPEMEVDAEGRQRYRHHYPLFALIRIAEIDPEAVSNILKKIIIPNNPYVGDQIIQCLAKIHDRRCIVQLRSLIVQFGHRQNRTSWLWLRELLSSWIKADAIDDFFNVLEMYLKSAVDLSLDKSLHSNEWLTKQIDEELLNGLTPKYPFEIIKITFLALCRLVEHERIYHKEDNLDDDDPSTFWLEDFKSLPPHHRGIDGVLAIRLYAAATEVYKSGVKTQIDEVNVLLQSSPWQLFKRLRYQLYADYPTLSLEFARNEILGRIGELNKLDHLHDFETAQYLNTHATLHKDAFLSSVDVKRFYDVVVTGPIDKKNKPIEGYNKNRFIEKQLWPIAPLLKEEQLDVYRKLIPDDAGYDIQTYKPFRSGGSYPVQQVSPLSDEDLESMSNERLWDYLKTWKPKTDYASHQQWTVEDVNALATKLAALVEKRPERFIPETEWWKKINRPEILLKLLERGSERIANKLGKANNPPATIIPDTDWANWFGIAESIISKNIDANTTDNEEGDKKSNWSWARIVVTRFLTNAITCGQMPERYMPAMEMFFTNLVEGEDLRLVEKNDSLTYDWFSIAINSVRGDAIEGLLELAQCKKKAGKEIDKWIFELISSRLVLTDESPATFALLGAKLRFVIYLFGEKIKANPSLLLPDNMPSNQNAVIISHFRYDSPWIVVLQMFPDILDRANIILEGMSHEAKDDSAKDYRRDYGTRLGTHIACYYWNDSFSSEVAGMATLNRFFAVASPKTRAYLISEIGTIFKKPNKENDEKLLKRVMHIWEWRFDQIKLKLKDGESLPTFEGELGQILDWLDCECFPFDWRVRHAKESIKLLQKMPQPYGLLATIKEFSKQPERIDAALELLGLILARPSDELRWAIQPNEISLVISNGLSSSNDGIRHQAEACRDLLLKLGFFELLNLKDVK